ncbi:ABC-type antimicrobial peptide transport system permease component [Desulfocucumis palustris]|uniref:ABC-type antimicrobial peptide transport system permease component n=1 Tax=Desulfocucumis palustris TaxID=1898651 RepID=A0A2L2XC65_9FIRM|nr:ABC transporter permease [Desulfocucumis palustris]GBF33692.1 ABC-type antimicrobial peptide transport system permease component [Desulfocucumis palustris]
MKPAKSAYPAYLILALGILVLTWSIVLGSSLPAKLAELGGPHKTNKITATWLSNSNQPEEGSFSLKDMRQLTQYSLRDYDLAYAMEASTSAAYQKNQSQAQVLGVNDRYDQFHQINLRSGCFLTFEQENQQVAVIDEDLAQALFQNCNVVGRKIKLYGREFKITGVAGVDHSLLGTLTDRGYGTVYIPAKKMLELEEDCKITSLEVETRDAGTTGLNAAVLETALASIGQDPANYKIIDYNVAGLLMEQENLLRNFVAGTVAIVMLFGWLRRKIRGIYHFCRLRLRDKYWSEMIKGDAARLVPGMAEVLALAAVLLLLWKLIRFTLYIPPENIPNELIDASFWAELIKKGIQTGLQSAGYVAPPGEVQFNILNTMQNWNLFLNIFLGWPLFLLGLYQIKLLKEKLVKVEVFCSVFMLAALSLGTTLLLIIKMPPVIGSGEVLLVFSSIFLIIRSGDTPAEV